jgi:hypothetical protein
MGIRAVGMICAAAGDWFGGILRFRLGYRLGFGLRKCEFRLILVRDLAVPFFFRFFLRFPIPHF